MSEFLLVAPAGWTMLNWEYLTNNLPNFSSSNVLSMCNTGNVDNDIGSLLRADNQIPQDAYVAEAKLIDDSYFMVRMV